MNILHLLTIFGLPTRMSLFGPDKIWNDYWRKINGLNLPTMSSGKAGDYPQVKLSNLILQTNRDKEQIVVENLDTDSQ